MSETEIIELSVTIDRQLFYDDNGMFGVYAMTPNNNTHNIPLNEYGNFVVNGTTPKLTVGKDYDIEIKPSKHHKYGDGYSFVAVKAQRPKTVREQQEYIKALITENQYQEIIKVYPNHLVLDLMENNTFDYSNMKGIKESTYQKIKKKLFDNLEIHEAMVELKELDITFEAMKRLVDHFGTASLVVQKVKNNIYELCVVPLFGFRRVDEYALRRGDDPTNPNRIKAAVYYLLKEDASSGHSWISLKKLSEQLVKLLEIDTLHIQTTLENLKANDKKLYFDDKKAALQKNYHYEKTIMNKLLDMMSSPVNTIGIDGKSKIQEQEKELGITYTNEQKLAIQKAIDNNVLIINGRAGSGKSFSVKGILKALNDYTYCCCALSGKAARILGQQGLNAMTIHRMLGLDPKGGFVHNEENRLPYDIVILDESSMANNYLIYSILIALKDGAKMIFVGDNGQLPSIGTGAIFDDLLQTNILPQQELTIIHRQAQKSGILSSANKIRDGQQINGRYDHSTQIYGELKDMVLIPLQDKVYIKDIVLEICEKYKSNDLFEFQIITGLTGKSSKSPESLNVKNLNISLQAIFNDINKPYVSRGGYDYRVGDKIIQNGNNYEAGEEGEVSIYNGTIGQIVHIDFDADKSKQDHKLHIKFEDIDEIIIYNKEDMKQIELAYAISVHKSQGSGVKHVIFAFDYASYMLLSREFVYTGITRASEGCVMITENAALHYAIEKVAGGSRRTFLKELLFEYKE